MVNGTMVHIYIYKYAYSKWLVAVVVDGGFQ